MKKILYFLLPLVVLATSCGEDDEVGSRPTRNIHDPYYNGIETTELNFTRLGGIENVTVKTNIADWKCVSDADWCDVSNVEWSDSTMKVVVTENKTESVRTATITITVDSNTAEVKVTQTGLGPEIVLSKNIYSGIKRIGETITVPVSALGEYRIIHPSGVNWITETAASRPDMLQFDISVNDGDDERTAVLRLEAVENPLFFAEITISQFGKTYVLSDYRSQEAQIWSNVTEKNEGSIYNLTDGNTESFFHSIWSNDRGGIDKNGQNFDKPSVNGMIVVDLLEDVDNFYMSFTTRGSGRNNGCPSHIRVWGSTSFNPSNWLASGGVLTKADYKPADEGAVEIIDVSSGLPSEASTKYVFDNYSAPGVGATVKSATPVRYIWVEVVKATNYESSETPKPTSSSWAMSELEVRLLEQEAD